MRYAIIAAWIVAATAWAGPQVVWKDSSVRPYWPSTIAWPDGRETLGANTEQVEESGLARREREDEWVPREKAAADAAKAAQAAAEAEKAAFAADKAFKAAKLDSAAAKGAKAKDADTAAAFADLVAALKETQENKP